MTGFKPGQIVLVPFPFTDLQTTKKRPALVLSTISSRSLPSILILAMITSELQGESLMGDHILLHWQETGLLHPSRVRVAKVVSVEERLVIKKIGRIHAVDYTHIARQFKKVFSEWA